MEQTMLQAALGEVRADGEMLRLIAPSYAGKEGELTAVLQYVYQSVVLGEMGETETSRRVLSVAVSEMRHLELLGKLICRLGAPPVFTACPPYPVGYYSASCVNYAKTPRQMLSADVCAEENAIAAYERVLCRIRSGAAACVLTSILEEEKEHLHCFNELLSHY